MLVSSCCASEGSVIYGVKDRDMQQRVAEERCCVSVDLRLASGAVMERASDIFQGSSLLRSPWNPYWSELIMLIWQNKCLG